MAKDWSERLNQVNFQCGLCTHAWEGVPDLIEESAADTWHTWRYFAKCTRCGHENVPQVRWERALLKAHQESTGPITPEGKAASAANLAGHPTPEEARRTRFNAMKHGMSARTATYFPAKPDGYAFCERCDVNRGWCYQQPACVKQTEIFLVHHAAFEQRNPKLLTKLHADTAAALSASLQMCLQAVLGDGAVIKTPRVELSKDGAPIAMTYLNADGEKVQIYDYVANPAFKPIADLITRLGLSMGDLGMTHRAAEEEEERQAGTLRIDDASTKETMRDFGKRLLIAHDQARGQIAAAQLAKARDPVYIEHMANGDSP